MSNVLKAVTQNGTSIWLDDLSRERLVEGGTSRYLPSLISKEWVRGVTTNPAIFAAAISNSPIYQSDITRMAAQGKDAEAIINALTTDDVKQACDLFEEIFESSNGVDGRVSIEVDPRLARDTAATIVQARELWKEVSRPNLLIKVPATIEGIPAIRTLISEGISVNVTIIFSVPRYKEVLEAFLLGLEDRHSRGEPVQGIHSVASFFVSRVDTEIDGRIRKEHLPLNSNLKALEGKAAIANARLAYEHFLDVKSSPRWAVLSQAGAAIQRPLWASTGVKDPSYPPTMYVSELIAPDTVNTMPEPTLIALRDSDLIPSENISAFFDQSRAVLAELSTLGIDINEVAEKLENEGIAKFITPWLELISTVERAAQR